MIPNVLNFHYNNNNVKRIYKGSTLVWPNALGALSFTYTTTDKKIATPYKAEACDASIVSNTYNSTQNIGTIVFDSSIYKIGSYFLENVSHRLDNLKTVNIPDGVEIIEYHSFEHCRNITKANFPNTLTNIGYNSFNDCSSINNVVIPNSVTTLGIGVFSNCTSLSNITLSKNLITLDNGVFQNDTALQNISLPNKLQVIGRVCFKNCTNLSDVVVPASVKSIGNGAFYNCTSFTSVTILSEEPPSIVFNGGEYTLNIFDFDGEGYAYPIYVPANSLSKYKNHTYWKRYANRIFPLPVPEPTGQQYITYTSTDNNIVVPNNESGFGEAVIVSNEYSNGIGTITFDRDVLGIIASAFKNCSTLQTITIPNKVNTLGNYAFSGCTNLINVSLGSAVTTIGDFTFEHCTNLTSITIPNSVTLIGRGVFAFSGITNIIIPNSVTRLGNSVSGDVFAGCTNLTSITLGNRLKAIDHNSFQYTALSTITIPSSVESIGSHVFLSTDLTTMYVLPTVPPALGVGTFMYSMLPTIYVPAGSVEAYKSDLKWSNFADNIQPIPS